MPNGEPHFEIHPLNEEMEGPLDPGWTVNLRYWSWRFYDGRGTLLAVSDPDARLTREECVIAISRVGLFAADAARRPIMNFDP
jgi:hypothetical protein